MKELIDYLLSVTSLISISISHSISHSTPQPPLIVLPTSLSITHHSSSSSSSYQAIPPSTSVKEDR